MPFPKTQSTRLRPHAPIYQRETHRIAYVREHVITCQPSTSTSDPLSNQDLRIGVFVYANLWPGIPFVFAPPLSLTKTKLLTSICASSMCSINSRVPFPDDLSQTFPSPRHRKLYKWVRMYIQNQTNVVVSQRCVEDPKCLVFVVCLRNNKALANNATLCPGGKALLSLRLFPGSSTKVNLSNGGIWLLSKSGGS